MSQRQERGARKRPQSAPAPPAEPGSTRYALALPVVFTAGLLAFTALPQVHQHPVLLPTFVAVAALLGLWTTILAILTGRSGRALSLSVGLRAQHYLQACAHLSIYIYWGSYWHQVSDSAYLIAAQIVFAFAFDALLTWSRHPHYVLGFGPLPIIFSTNLFLWFKPDWFYFQFLMVAVGFAAKALIRWQKDGRSTHIFNPSSFPLSLFSLGLILTNTTDRTWGSEIAVTQLMPPHMYLLIFLVTLPAQFLFGVASMTVAAVGTTFAFGSMYHAMTGSYFFFEPGIPIAVFLGMHLLFTDPSTSPRTELGRLIFGVLYGASVIALYAIFTRLGMPTFYDKLLGVPVLNLLIQVIDRLARSSPLRALDPAALGGTLKPRQRNLAYMAAWAIVFVTLQTVTSDGVALARADVLTQFGEREAAIAAYREIRQRDPENAVVANKLGVALLQSGRLDEAIDPLQAAAALTPADAEAQNNLGLALLQRGRTQDAVTTLTNAVNARPSYAEARYNLAQALLASDKPGDAMTQLTAALDTRADWATALGLLAWIHATTRQPDVYNPSESLRLATRAAALAKEDVAVLDALAAAYAANGRFPEAVQTAESALAHASRERPELAPGIEQRLSRYRSGRPLVDPPSHP